MGASCSNVEKGKTGQRSMAAGADVDDLEGSAGEHAEDAEDLIQSDPSEDEDDAKRMDAVDTLKALGATLKRGKTMAMKEAIYTAKKLNADHTAIEEAETQLDLHKRQQRRDAMEAEVVEFFEPWCKANTEIPAVKNILKKAKEADCAHPVIQRCEERLALLIATRPLETEETEHAKEYMKKSCDDFVRLSTEGGGRPVVFLNLEDGRKISATMSLDAPLQNLLLQVEDREELIEVPVSSLVARPAVHDSQVQRARGYRLLEEEDADCAVALKHNGGVWCIIEPTVVRRDRFVEAIVILVLACKLGSGSSPRSSPR